MSNAGWLIDKSALARISTSRDGEEWEGRIQRGLVQITTATILEIGYSSRTALDWTERVDMPPMPMMPIATLTPSIEGRAVEVQALLLRAGQHRAPSVPGLLIAATAELTGLTVLHVDKDFELIAKLTGQPVERLRFDGS